MIQPKQRALYLQTADAICHFITKNNLVIGDKLPSERTLSTTLNISRNSIRESLRYLESQGIITVRVGSGSYIARTLDDASVFIQFKKINYQENLEIKIYLELLLAELILPHITTQDIQILNTYIRQMEEEAKSGYFSHEVDSQFHQHLLSLSPNTTLKNLLGDITHLLDGLWTDSNDYPEDSFLNTLPYHKGIVEGYAQKNLSIIRDNYNLMLKEDIEIFDSLLQSSQA